MSKFLHFCYGTADSFGKRFFPKLLVFSVFLGFFHIRSVPLRLCRPEVRILPGTPKSPENIALSGLSLFHLLLFFHFCQFITPFIDCIIIHPRFTRFLAFDYNLTTILSKHICFSRETKDLFALFFFLFLIFAILSPTILL